MRLFAGIYTHVALSIKSAVSKLELIQKCSCVYHLGLAYKGAGKYKVFLSEANILVSTAYYLC